MRMTEPIWNSTQDVRRLLSYLSRNKRFLVSARKLRLFGCASVDRVRAYLTDERLEKAFEAGEQYSDGLIDERQARSARRSALQARRARDQGFFQPLDGRLAASAAHAVSALVLIPPQPPSSRQLQRAAMSVALTASRHVVQAVVYAKRLPERRAADSEDGGTFKALMRTVRDSLVRNIIGQLPSTSDRSAASEERACQSELLRDIFGNPFRAESVDPAWLNRTVVNLAQGIYEEHGFDRLPILADALEEAGCVSQEVLQHCRNQGEHVRGCWVVDLILGKA
jgi:hypothetical protein